VQSRLGLRAVNTKLPFYFLWKLVSNTVAAKSAGTKPGHLTFQQIGCVKLGRGARNDHGQLLC
jgi:hypothetical protein